MINDPDLEQPVTLALVRDRLRQSLLVEGVEAEHGDFGTEQSLYVEVERLIEEYGEDATAVDLTAVKASEELSEVIEAILDDSEEEVPPTLGAATP